MSQKASIWRGIKQGGVYSFRVIQVVLLYLLVVFGPDYWREMRQEYFAISDPERAVFGLWGCRNPCVIKYDGGGLIVAYVGVATQFLRNGKTLVIDGPCYSACAILADFARPNVCITSRATFQFHMAYGAFRRFEPPASSDVRAWVISRGGFPEDGFLPMPFQDARQFWPKC